MQIGRVIEIRTFEPRIIPITIPKPKPQEDPIEVPDWPKPAEVPVEDPAVKE